MADQTNPTNQTPTSTPTGGGNNMMIWGGLVLIILILGGAIYWSRANNTAPAESPEAAVEDDIRLSDDELGEAPDQGPAGEKVGEVKEFVVTGSNFAFDPSEIRVNQGDTVKITLTNGSTMPHDWRLDEFNAATDIIQPGQEDTIEFVASEAGEFEYYCSVGQHRQMGMVGKLIVE